jgi:hypothetical protein
MVLIFKPLLNTLFSELELVVGCVQSQLDERLIQVFRCRSCSRKIQVQLLKFVCITVHTTN